jgi:hypothetical protein
LELPPRIAKVMRTPNRTEKGGIVKIIVISALALGLTAFGAQAQQRDNDEAINQGSSTSTAQPGTPTTDQVDKASRPEDGEAKSKVESKNNESSAATEVDQAGQSDQLKVKRNRERSQARSGVSSRHRTRTSPSTSEDVPSGDRDASKAKDRTDLGMSGSTGSSGSVSGAVSTPPPDNSSGDSVARPAAPSPTDDQWPIDSITPPPKDKPENK